MIILRIQRTWRDVAHFLVTVLLRGWFPLVLFILGMVFRIHLLTVVAGAFLLRHYAWTQIDYLFPVTFLKEGDRLLVRFMGCRMPLSPEDSFLVIEKADVMGRMAPKRYHLRLVRNCGVRWQRLLKNRIRLSRKDHRNMVEEMMAIHNRTGLRFMDNHPRPGEEDEQRTEWNLFLGLLESISQ